MARGLKWAGHCANDPRCEGHRHDESALSFVLHEFGLKPVAPNWESFGMARHVPDYDVVKMRTLIIENIGSKGMASGYDSGLVDLEELCR